MPWRAVGGQVFAIACLLSTRYDSAMSAARLLRTARRRAGLSQRALAEAAGVPQSTVARIELGALSPRANTLERLLRGAGQALSTEPALGIGVDRTQMRERLRLTPGERLRLAAADSAGLARLRRAAR
jgi:transcriptional regulator with XRE-family HTH domain